MSSTRVQQGIHAKHEHCEPSEVDGSLYSLEYWLTEGMDEQDSHAQQSGNLATLPSHGKWNIEENILK